MRKQPVRHKEVIDTDLLGELLQAVPPQMPPPGLRAKVLARALGARVLTDTRKTTPFGGYLDSFMVMFDLDMDRSSEILKKAASQDSDTFASCPIPGAQLFYFSGGPRVATATCGVLKIAAGAVFPSHQHEGDEHVLVLQGHATENSGRIYQPGDVVHQKQGSRHSFRAHSDGPLLFAVVLEKSNKWLIGQIVLDYVFKRWRFS